MGNRHISTLVVSGRLAEAKDLSIVTSANSDALKHFRDAGGGLDDSNGLGAIVPSFLSASRTSPRAGTMMLSISPSPLYLAVEALNGEARDRSRVIDLLEVLDSLAAESPSPQAWQELRKVFSHSFVDGLSSDDLIKLVNDAGKTTNPTVQIIYYLAATIRPDCSLAKAFYIHSSLAWIPNAFTHDNALRRKLWQPFIDLYWRKALEERAFQFSLPRATKNAFQACQLLPKEDQVKAILRAVGEGLSVQMRPEDRRYLYAAE